jgi:GNAT superfamily N-acetyltransferase
MATGPAIRRATLDDQPAIAELMAANDEPQGWPGIPGWPYLAFLVTHGDARVAVDGDAVVGFGASVEAGPITHLADLFVDPGRHGGGIGRTLLAAVMPADRPRTTFASADPRAVPIYARSGMRPSWPLLYLEGDPRRLPAAADLPAAETVPLEAFTKIHRDLTGVARPDLDRYQSGLPGAATIVARDGGSVVAAGVVRNLRVRTARALDRLVITAEATEADATRILLAAIRAAAVEGQPVDVLVPGPNPALPVLLDAGFRMLDRDIYCESEPGLIDPVRRIPNTGFV